MEFQVKEAIQRSGEMKCRRMAVQRVKPQVSRLSVMHVTDRLGTVDPYRAEARMLPTPQPVLRTASNHVRLHASVKIEPFICRCRRYNKERHRNHGNDK